MSYKYITIILQAVSEETEIPEARIISGARDAETVDARCLFFYFADKVAGANRSSVARFANTSVDRVRKLISTHEARRGYTIYRIQEEKIRTKLRAIYEKQNA